MNVIGLGVGTSGVKSTVFGFGKNSDAISSAYAEYGLICTQAGIFEFDPNIILKKTYRP